MGRTVDPFSRRSMNGTGTNSVGKTYLPAAGREGNAPDWPLSYEPSQTEAQMWEQLWHTPQAIMWENNIPTRIIARYVMAAAATEEPADLVSSLLSEVRQMEDRLGLTPGALNKLNWEIVDAPTAAEADEIERRERERIERFANL